MSDLAIVIVNFNAQDDLDRCLRSLHAHPPSRAHEIVVVDNASTDESAARTRRDWPSVRLLDLGTNGGFARACNAGFRHTDSPLVLLLNSDTIVPSGELDRLVEALLSDDDCAVAGPRLIDGAGQIEISWGHMIGPFNELRQKALAGLHAIGVPPVTAFVSRRAHQVRFPDWVSGACLLVRRSDAQAVGYLDERFFMYAEDVDFCAALRSRGAAHPLHASRRATAPQGPLGERCPSSHHDGLPPKPAGLLRQAPPEMGPVASRLPPDERPAAVGLLAARGESLAAFDRRCIPPRAALSVVHDGSNTPGILPPRAWPWATAASA